VEPTSKLIVSDADRPGLRILPPDGAVAEPTVATVGGAEVSIASPIPDERQGFLRNRVPVTALVVAASVVAFCSRPLGAGAAIAAFVAAVVVVLAAVDIERRIIPNRVVLPATAIVLVGRVAFFPDRVLEFVLASVLVAGALLISNLIRSSWMGMGDVKFVMLLGAALGWGVVGAVAIAFLSIFPFALATLIRGGLRARTTALPFGPFLALGALAILIGPQVAGIGAG
jgi:leader peptidase (prepilin peptidase)/N-methyltransferase